MGSQRLILQFIHKIDDCMLNCQTEGIGEINLSEEEKLSKRRFNTKETGTL